MDSFTEENDFSNILIINYVIYRIIGFLFRHTITRMNLHKCNIPNLFLNCIKHFLSLKTLSCKHVKCKCNNNNNNGINNGWDHKFAKRTVRS